MGRKLALIIGNSQYDDPRLASLTTADVDVREVADVLRAPAIGQFDEVLELPDQGLAVVRRSIAQFFSQGKKDDLLVFYFSGHGVKDENGHLYLAVKDTEHNLLAGTSIEAAFITAQMDRSYSKRQVLILDCCHSGAFAYGAKAGERQAVGIGPAFEGTGYGHVVLTATDATQYAWEGDQVIGESDKSVFTHYLLQGLRTGEADRDADGLITIDELYDYVYERVVSETPRQTPGKWSYKQQGDIVVARNPHPAVRPAELPLEVRALLESSLSRLRAEAIPELAALLHGRHRGLALAARRALEELCTDDSRKVSAAAEAVLTMLPQAGLPDPAPPVTPIVEGAGSDNRTDEVEQEAREHQQYVAALVNAADQATSHQEAIEALNAALVVDPAHQAARQLLSLRTAALQHQASESARREEERSRAEADAGRVAAAEAERQRHESARTIETPRAIDRPGWTEQTRNIWRHRLNAARTPLRSVRSFLAPSRPLPLVLVALVFAAGLILWGMRRHEAPAPAPTATAFQPPAPPLAPSQFATAVPVPLPSPPADTEATASAGAGLPRTAGESPQPAASKAAPASDRDTSIERLLVQGDGLMAAQNYAGALTAYQEAERLGSAAGRERAAKARQEKAQQVRSRLNRAERLLDTGEYDEAIRSADEALTLDPESTEARNLRKRVTDAQSFERTLRVKPQ